jgi:ubiquinone/menaquinone biosynthesis C-methylase UbiE
VETPTKDDKTLDYEPGVLRVLQSKEQTRHYYNKIARVYDLLSEEAEKPMREAGLKKLAPAQGERILEIGFGTGHSLVQIARAVGPGGKALGIDISDEMLRHAQELLAKEGLADRAELRCGDAEQLPFEAGTLDGIFFSFTLELFDTPELPKVLVECKRVLRPGGRIVVVAVSREGKQGVMLNLYEWTHKHFPNLMDCRPIYVRRGLEAAGFTIKETDVESMWVPVEIVLAVKAG